MKATDMLEVSEESKMMFELMSGRTEIGFNMSHMPRVCEQLQVNNGWLSIQCSAGHYCLPRITKDDIHTYDSYEVAILDGSHNIIGDVERLTRLLAGFDRLSEFMGCFSSPVFGYVPRDLVNELYEFMIEKCFK